MRFNSQTHPTIPSVAYSLMFRRRRDSSFWLYVFTVSPSRQRMGVWIIFLRRSRSTSLRNSLEGHYVPVASLSQPMLRSPACLQLLLAEAAGIRCIRTRVGLGSPLLNDRGG
jgi:hypothetical protein